MIKVLMVFIQESGEQFL